jgi:hypothetical protein
LKKKEESKVRNNLYFVGAIKTVNNEEIILLFTPIINYLVLLMVKACKSKVK